MELKPISVVVLPLPAQGHLNQLLLLARRLASLSIPVHFVSSAAHNRQARDRSSPASSPDDHLHFHDLPLPPYPAPPPPTDPRPDPSHFPSHLQPLFDAAVLHFPSPLSSLLSSLSSSSRRLVLVHDSAMSFSASLASSLPNAEVFVFHTASAYANLFFRLNCPLSSPPPPRRARGQQAALSFDDCFSEEFMLFIKAQHKMAARAQGRILNTCRAIDGEFIDGLALQPDWAGQKVFAVGPLNPIDVGGRRGHACLDWLDRQPERSVLYISFGTITSLPRPQAAELAKALESSGQRFVWVVRDADRGDIYAGGGADRAADVAADSTTVMKKGVVVRGWAPQVEVLAHGATAGFLSHCGWNSCMESLTLGVPMLTWPMHSDQPRNAVLVTEVVGAGVVGREWGRRREVVGAAEIREMIGRLVDGEEGRAAARRAEEVGVAMRGCGRREEELRDFVAHICRI